MYKLIQFLVILVLFVSNDSLHGQANAKNKKPIDETRYFDYSGNPFYFRKNQHGIGYLENVDKTYDRNNVNINLISKAVEIYEGDSYIEINRKKVQKVDFDYEDYKISISPDPIDKEGFIANLYSSDQHKLIHKIYVHLEERSYNSPGKIMEKTLIRRKEEYILHHEGMPYNVELKKKEILKILGKNAEAIAKKTKNKLKNQWQFIDLLKALDESV